VFAVAAPIANRTTATAVTAVPMIVRGPNVRLTIDESIQTRIEYPAALSGGGGQLGPEREKRDGKRLAHPAHDARP
jgi:hypothetical protein